MATPTLDQIRRLAEEYLEKIDSVTGAEFARGEDGPERERLRKALDEYNRERLARDAMAFRDCLPLHAGGRGVK
jgi:hypothetical protein